MAVGCFSAAWIWRGEEKQMIQSKWPRNARPMAVGAFAALVGLQAFAADLVRTSGGQVEGVTTTDGKIRMFKGIAYAAPPVGDLRWKAPQPAAAWEGVRKAAEFGSRCMQGAIYSDMIFRDKGISEDCLNLNIWTPAASADARLPVMVW